MFKPKAMRHIVLHLMTDDLPQTSLTLAEMGVFCPEQDDRLTEKIPETIGDEYREVFHQASSQGYPHGFIWGTGADGWDELTLYAPQPYDRNSVYAYSIGVPDGSLVREWNGVRVGR